MNRIELVPRLLEIVFQETANAAADLFLDAAELIAKLFSPSEQAPQQAELPPPPGTPSLEQRVRQVLES